MPAMAEPHTTVSAPPPGAMIHVNLTCIGCGYSLLGLPADGRCPECGRPAADSFVTFPEPGWAANSLQVAAGAMIVWVVSIGTLCLWSLAPMARLVTLVAHAQLRFGWKPRGEFEAPVRMLWRTSLLSALCSAAGLIAGMLLFSLANMREDIPEWSPFVCIGAYLAGELLSLLNTWVFFGLLARMARRIRRDAVAGAAGKVRVLITVGVVGLVLLGVALLVGTRWGPFQDPYTAWIIAAPALVFVLTGAVGAVWQIVVTFRLAAALHRTAPEGVPLWAPPFPPPAAPPTPTPAAPPTAP